MELYLNKDTQLCMSLAARHRAEAFEDNLAPSRPLSMSA
jgi:hypothetical protein